MSEFVIRLQCFESRILYECMLVCELHSYNDLHQLLDVDDVSVDVIVGGPDSLLCIMELMVYNLVDDCREVINFTFSCDDFGHFPRFI